MIKWRLLAGKARWQRRQDVEQEKREDKDQVNVQPNPQWSDTPLGFIQNNQTLDLSVVATAVVMIQVVRLVPSHGYKLGGVLE
jgi:hypothetical protein